MKKYHEMTPKYLSAHKKNTRLTLISVMIAVALVTTIFSMLDVFIRFEKQQIISDCGDYHIMIDDITDKESAAISGRIDVDAAIIFGQIDDAKMNGKEVVIATGDEAVSNIFTSGFNHYDVLEGTYPKTANEVVVEQWTAKRDGLRINDTVEITLDDRSEIFQISGICADCSSTKAEGVIGLFMPITGQYTLAPDMESDLIIRFKDNVKITNAENDIMQTLDIAEDRIGRNERLLAFSGESKNDTVMSIYAAGAVLFIIVLAAGVMMIYNTFNISVINRVHQFGLLRCIGASKKQIKRLVKSEGRFIALRAIPVGVAAGILISFICSAILKFYNSSFFADVSLFYISIIGIIAGIAVGMLTVFIASLVPAKKAAHVSPVNAVSGLGEIKALGKQKKGVLTDIFHVETALGIRNAGAKKRTLVLMSASIAISIVLFLGFQVLINLMYSSMRTNKAYTPDIELVSESRLDDELMTELASLEGVNHVYGRMFSHVDAVFDASRLTDIYNAEVGDVAVKADGTFEAPEQSWLISYDKQQLKWAKTDRYAGTLSEEKLNEGNGIIAVVMNIRDGHSMETASLALGDTVTIETISGPREYTVMGILRKVPFSDTSLNLTTFITTERLFSEITGESAYDVIDAQLRNRNQEQTIAKINGMIGADVDFLDARQRNAEVSQAFLTMAIFLYGFVIIIALISLLNIVNTMQTSVSSKTRYLGVMRAIGMSGKQLNRMVAAEAGTYGLVGCVSGIILGILLQILLINKVMVNAHMIWTFPMAQVIIIFIIILLITLLATIRPIREIKDKGISEIIGFLQ